MKKFWKSLMFALAGVFALSSCEDVPAPYPIPNGEKQQSTTIETIGDGSFASPYTVADALALIKGNQIPSDPVYVKGVVTAVGIEQNGELTDLPGTSYGNATYFISDVDKEGNPTGTPFEIYRGKGLGGEKMNTADYIKVGDEVIVYGTLVLFKSTPEMSTGSELVKLNDKVIEPKEPTQDGEAAGEGTKESPYNVAAANKLIEGLQETTDSKNPYASDEVFVKGRITKIDGIDTSYGNATYFIADTNESGNTVGRELEVYRGYYLGGEKFTATDQIKVGDEVVVQGQLVNFKGTYEFTTKNKIYSLNGETAGGDTPDPQPSGDPKGTGTLEDPYNVPAAFQLIGTLAETTDAKNPNASDEVYVKGIISKINDVDTGQYGNATYFISEDGTTTSSQLEIYRGYFLEGAKFTAADQIKVGQEVMVVGKLVNFRGTYEFTTGSKIASIDGITDPGDLPETPDDPDPETPDTPSDPVAGMSVISSQIVSGQSGSVALETNKYGSQSVDDVSTWYTFTIGDVTFTGCKVCIAAESNGGGIQMQGNASDKSKQGFITNVTPFTPIKTITVKAHIASGSQYDPSFHLYAGTATHPTGTAIEGNMSKDGNNYTFVYDLSGSNYTHFTIANDLVGVLYIDGFTVETK